MKKVILAVASLTCLVLGTAALAASGAPGIGSVAGNVTKNLDQVAKLITGASFVAGMAFIVGAIVKFKAHKDNPTQIPIGTPIALLFVGAALIFVTSVYDVGGATLFGSSGITTPPGTSGVAKWGKQG